MGAALTPSGYHCSSEDRYCLRNGREVVFAGKSGESKTSVHGHWIPAIPTGCLPPGLNTGAALSSAVTGSVAG